MSIPLPPPVAYGATDLEDGRIYDAWYEPIEGCTVPLHTADQLHAHAAAVSAERDAEIANLKTVMVAAAEQLKTRTIRLNDADFAKLKAIGMDRLRAWINRTKVK